MADSSNTLVRNAMLQAIKDWNPSSVGTAIIIAAYSADSDTAELKRATATYGTPASSSMNITDHLVLNIDAGDSVSHLRILKGTYPNDYYIYKKDITTESFTYAGSITITSAEISIADA